MDCMCTFRNWEHMVPLALFSPYTQFITVVQVTKLRDEVARVRQVLSNRDEESAESIQKAGADLQKASLKLFEMAYKKVYTSIVHHIV